jgi:N-glycosylase/DNA lyase
MKLQQSPGHAARRVQNFTAKGREVREGREVKMISILRLSSFLPALRLEIAQQHLARLARCKLAVGRVGILDGEAV